MAVHTARSVCVSELLKEVCCDLSHQPHAPVPLHSHPPLHPDDVHRKNDDITQFVSAVPTVKSVVCTATHIRFRLFRTSHDHKPQHADKGMLRCCKRSEV